MSTQTQCRDLYRQWSAASIRYDNARGANPLERLRLNGDADRVYSALEHARRDAREQFAAERGWQSSSWFTLDQLRSGKTDRRSSADWGNGVAYLWPLIDHPDWFTCDGRPAAIVTHVYSDWADVKESARKHRFTIEKLPWSWYSPRTTAAIMSAAS